MTSDPTKPIRGYALRSRAEWVEDPDKDTRTCDPNLRHIFPTAEAARNWVTRYRLRHASNKKFALIKLLASRKLRLEKVLILTAKRVSPASDREYTFKYTERPLYTSSDAGVPIPFLHASIKIPILKFQYILRKDDSGFRDRFTIIESDAYCGPGGTSYPVRFEVMDFRWETVEV